MGMPEDGLAFFGAAVDKVAAEFGVDPREPGWEGVWAGAGVPEAGIANAGAAFDKVLGDSAAMRDSPAKLVVEIQFMTKEYYAMRKKTHAWYKVVRADHAEGMVLDYRTRAGSRGGGVRLACHHGRLLSSVVALNREQTLCSECGDVMFL